MRGENGMFTAKPRSKTENCRRGRCEEVNRGVMTKEVSLSVITGERSKVSNSTTG